MQGDSRILILSRYDRLGASSRLRAFQYIPFLEMAGFEVTKAAFFDDRYLTHLYATRKRRLWSIIRRYIRRIRDIKTAKQYSAIWVEKEVFPFLPGLFENFLVRARIPYIVDYDDATFHTYDNHRAFLVRRLLGEKLDTLIKNANCVTVGNGYLETYARSHGAKHVKFIPTVVDIRHYNVVDELPVDEFRIGWIGSPTTTKYLYEVQGALKKLSAERPIRLVTIGAWPLLDYGVPLEQHAWTENDEARLLRSIHVGIMPLPDTPWEQGKCGYKLIQYLASGRPVVASPVGINKDIVTDAVGYLVTSSDEWVRALRIFADNAARRRACGIAGRHLVEHQYSLGATAPRVVDILREAIDGGIRLGSSQCA